MASSLDQIQGVDDSANWLAAAHQGITDATLQQNNALAAQKRDLYQQAGALAAQGNFPEARNALFQGGDLDAGHTVQSWINTAHDRDLELANKTHEVTANLLRNIQTPEQADMALNVWQANGGDPATVAKIRQQFQQFGVAPVRDHYLNETGQHQALVQEQQNQRATAQKALADSMLAARDDPDKQLAVLKMAQAQGMPVDQYLTKQTAPADPFQNAATVPTTGSETAPGQSASIPQAGFERPQDAGGLPALPLPQSAPNVTEALAPGAYETILGQGGAGQGKAVFDADAKTDAAAAKGPGRGSATQQATQNVISGAVKRLGVKPEDVPEDIAQTAARAGGIVDLRDGNWIAVNPDGSVGALRQQFVNNQAKRYDPAVTAANAYARKGSESNVKLDTQLNRLESVKDQIQQLRDMTGEQGSPERNDFENSIGYITSHSGKQYWGSGNVPAIMSNLRSKTRTLQDELAQYVQSGGQGSDARAKNAFEVVGDLENSPNTQTFLKRLDSLESTIGSLHKTPHVDAASGGPQPQAPATSSSPRATAVGPNGHQIGWFGGNNWIDLQTGQPVQH